MSTSICGSNASVWKPLGPRVHPLAQRYSSAHRILRWKPPRIMPPRRSFRVIFDRPRGTPAGVARVCLCMATTSPSSPVSQSQANSPFSPVFPARIAACISRRFRGCSIRRSRQGDRQGSRREPSRPVWRLTLARFRGMECSRYSLRTRKMILPPTNEISTHPQTNPIATAYVCGYYQRRLSICPD